MLHYVHWLVSNCVCLLFGAEQIVYSGFMGGFCWKQLAAAAEVDEKAETEQKQSRCES